MAALGGVTGKLLAYAVGARGALKAGRSRLTRGMFGGTAKGLQTLSMGAGKGRSGPIPGGLLIRNPLQTAMKQAKVGLRTKLGLSGLDIKHGKRIGAAGLALGGTYALGKRRGERRMQRGIHPRGDFGPFR